MSQINKRIKKKVQKLSEAHHKCHELEELIRLHEAEIERLHKEQQKRVDDVINDMDYIINHATPGRVFIDKLELTLPNDEMIEAELYQVEDEVFVTYDGIVGQAKLHPEDDFDLNVGYNLAAARLILKLVELKFS